MATRADSLGLEAIFYSDTKSLKDMSLTHSHTYTHTYTHPSRGGALMQSNKKEKTPHLTIP